MIGDLNKYHQRLEHKYLRLTFPSVLRVSLLFLYSSLALDGLLEVIGVKLDESSVETRRYPSGIKLSTALLHSGLEGDILLTEAFHFFPLSGRK